MILSFTLSMPGRASWNGGWSGEDRLYVKTKSFTSKKAIEKARKILEKGYYVYCWSDGWRAGIAVAEVDSRKAAQLRKKSAGFCGYDWMVDTIIDYGQPMATHEVKEFLQKKVESETC